MSEEVKPDEVEAIEGDTAPSADTEGEPAAPRNYMGWALLATLLAFHTFFALSASLRPVADKEPKFLAQQVQLRLVASQRELFQTVQGAGGSSPEERAKVEEQSRDSLDEAVSELVPLTEKSRQAARLYAVMRTEQKRPVPAAMLDSLRKSKDPVDQAYLEIYGNASLSADQAKQLAAKIPERPFSNALARVHALEKGGDQSARKGTVSMWFAVRAIVLFVMGLGIFILSFIVWTAYASGRRQGKFNPRGHPIGRVTLPDADRLAMRGAQILAAFTALQVVLGLLARRGVSFGMAANIVMGLGILGIVVLLSRLAIDGKRITLANMGIGTERLGKNIGWGIAGFLAEIPVTMTLALLGSALFRFLPDPSHPATEAISESGNLISVVPILIFGSIVAPIWEEILFRGLLFPAIGRVTGRIITGALLSSLFFGLIHPQGPALVLALAGVGAMSCGLAYQTRSLIPSIVMHALHNSVVFMFALLML